MRASGRSDFFLIDRQSINGDNFTLDPHEGGHALRVLRLTTGAEIWLSDGQGTAYRARITATKQCGRSRLMELDQPRTADEYFAPGRGKFAVLSSGGEKSLTKWMRQLPPATGTSVVVGPEGDFSPQEIELLQAAGGSLVNLGPRRLRSETAAIQALSIINELLNMKDSKNE